MVKFQHSHIFNAPTEQYIFYNNKYMHKYLLFTYVIKQFDGLFIIH